SVPQVASTTKGSLTWAARTPSLSERGTKVCQLCGSRSTARESPGAYVWNSLLSFCGHCSPLSPWQSQSPRRASARPSMVSTVASAASLQARIGFALRARNQLFATRSRIALFIMAAPHGLGGPFIGPIMVTRTTEMIFLALLLDDEGAPGGEKSPRGGVDIVA